VITLVLGGARSGKSRVAERLAERTNRPVTYVATMHTADDPELAARVEEHRRRRPAQWTTVEGDEDLAGVIALVAGTVLIDSLGPWLASLPGMNADTTALLEVLARRADDTIIVSDEVGLSVHPETPVGRAFRDALGQLNQAVAAVADEVLLVVAGRTLSLPRDDAR
jgi:adenosylcobinamide kinase / adenosylcobinamide-phosphate guanylyltransferase